MEEEPKQAEQPTEPQAEPIAPSQEERRQQERVKIPIKRTVLAFIESEETEELASHLHLLDLSEGGMRITINTDLELETSIGIRFQVSSLVSTLSGEFESVCRVVWKKMTSGGNVTGLQFKLLKQDSAGHLQRILDFWSQRAELNLIRLWKPINAKLRVTEEETWSRTVLVQSASERGFQFKTNQCFQEDSVLLSRLLLHNGPMVTPVKVKWCIEVSGHSYEIGCEFSEMSDENRALLRLHLKRTGHASFRK